MGFTNIDFLGDDFGKKFIILKGKKEKLRRIINSRMQAVMVAAYAEWEEQAKAHFSNPADAARYLEGLYVDLSDPAEPRLVLKSGTFGSMLENMFSSFDLMPALRRAAYARGGKVKVPIGDKGKYTSPVTERPPIPPVNRIISIAQRSLDNPSNLSAALASMVSTRTRQDTANGTKPMGVYAGGTPNFRTVSVNPVISKSKKSKPKDMWKIPGYKGAMLTTQVISFINREKSSFVSDLTNGGYLVDV